MVPHPALAAKPHAVDALKDSHVDASEFMTPIRALLTDLDRLLEGDGAHLRRDLQSIVEQHRAMTLSIVRRERLAAEFDALHPLLLAVFDEAQLDGLIRGDSRSDATDDRIDDLRNKAEDIVARVFVDPQPLIDDLFDQSGRLENKCSSIAYECWRSGDKRRKAASNISKKAALEAKADFRDLLIKHGAYALYHSDALDDQQASTAA